MSRAFSLSVVILLALNGYAQTDDSTKWKSFPNLYNQPFKPHQSHSVADGSVSFNVSANLPNRFLYPFIRGGHLSDQTIDKTVNKEKTRRMDGHYRAGLSYIHLAENVRNYPNLFWYVRAGSEYRIAANLTADAMHLLFRGNTGQRKYTFDKSRYYQIQLNKIGGGFYYRGLKSKRPYNVEAGINLIHSGNMGMIKANRNNFLQGNEDSFTVGLNYEACFARGDGALSGGLGAGGDIRFNQLLNKNSTWGFSLTDWALVRYNGVNTYNAGNRFGFTGVFIPDVRRLGTDGYFQHHLDSFTQQLTNKKEDQQKTLWVAPVTQMYYCAKFKSGYYRLALLYSGTGALPVAEIKYFGFMRNSTMAGVSLGTLGFNYLNAEIMQKMGKRWFVQAGINHLEALVIPASLGGLGGRFGLQCVF